MIHKKAHDYRLYEKRSDVIVSRGMPVHSKSMGVSGECDIVEFEKSCDGISLYGHRGLYQAYPVEYKKGSQKDSLIDILQLTAQAICLEEMLTCEIQEGAIYYASVRRRERVVFTEELREQVRKNFEEMHNLYNKKYTPGVKWSKSCNACSLKDICIPKIGKAPAVKAYIRKRLDEN